jgi:KTSC domain-containing protein
MMNRHIAWLSLLVAASAVAAPPVVDVKYFGPVSTDGMQCAETPQSSFVREVCHRDDGVMLISLNGIWYAYCHVSDPVFRLMIAQPSVGSFYNSTIKMPQFSCRY